MNETDRLLVYPPELLDGVDPGIYPDMDNDMYHAGPGISSTQIKRVNRSPLHFIYPIVYPERMGAEKKSPALLFGTAAHKYILERETFDEEYVIEPSGINKRTKAGKEEYAAFCEQHAGKSFLSVDDLETIKWMHETTQMSEAWRNALANTQREISIYWRDDQNSLLCKCRPDAFKELILNGRRTVVIVDVKTTVDASYASFSKSLANFGYDISAAMYADGIRYAFPGIDDVRFLFAVVEKTPPFACAVYSLDPFSIEIGHRKYRYGLTLFENCLDTGEWPSYPDFVSPISLPKWAQ